MYGLLMCMIIILTNGWSVFVSYEWHVGAFLHQTAHSHLYSRKCSSIRARSKARTNTELLGFVPPNRRSLLVVLVSFTNELVGQPCFIFLALSYKLIYRTEMVALDEMCFVTEGVPCITELDPPQRQGWRRVLGWVLLI